MHSSAADTIGNIVKVVGVGREEENTTPSLPFGMGIFGMSIFAMSLLHLREKGATGRILLGAF